MYFFLYQPASLIEPDMVYYNGVLIDDSYQRGEVYDRIVAIFNKVNNNTYPWLGKTGKFYTMRGLFDVKDEKGRNLAFLFASDNPDFSKELAGMYQVIGYDATQSTKDTVDEFLVKEANHKPAIKFITLATIVLILIIIIISLL